MPSLSWSCWSFFTFKTGQSSTGNSNNTGATSTSNHVMLLSYSMRALQSVLVLGDYFHTHWTLRRARNTTKNFAKYGWSLLHSSHEMMLCVKKCVAANCCGVLNRVAI